MTTLAVELDGKAPAGWSVTGNDVQRADTYLSFTRDREGGQWFAPEITVSALDLPDAGTSLEVLAAERVSAAFKKYSKVRLRRGEFISRSAPEVYGQEIFFETEFSPGDRIGISQSEILFTFTGFKPRVLLFLLVAPEPIFQDCLPDFKALFDSIVVKESE